jgi:hypothetical protein
MLKASGTADARRALANGHPDNLKTRAADQPPSAEIRAESLIRVEEPYGVSSDASECWSV